MIGSNNQAKNRTTVLKRQYFIRLDVAFREKIKELHGDELKILLALGLRVNSDGKAWPSLALLAQDTGLPRWAVQRNLSKLEKAGFIKITRCIENNRRRNSYSINHYFAFGNGHTTAERNPLQLSQIESDVQKGGEIGSLVAPGAQCKSEPSLLHPVAIGPELQIGGRSAQGRITNINFVDALASTIAHRQPLQNNHGELNSSSPRQVRRKTTVTRAKAPPDPRVAEVFRSLEQRLVYQIPNYAKEGAAIKRALAMGYQPEQILDCWEKVKSFDFWQGKWLPLAKVTENLGEFVAGRLEDSARRLANGRPRQKPEQKPRELGGHPGKRTVSLEPIVSGPDPGIWDEL